MSQTQANFSFSNGTRLEIAQGDLTQEPVDAIVNAANALLAHGGGVAAAIARSGGPQIQAESDAWTRTHGPVSHAEPAYTNGGRLPARYVIHAVGPVWGDGDEDRKLAAAIRGSLDCARRLSLHSIAFPAISTGIFGFPKDRAARIFFETLQEDAKEHPTPGLDLVRLVLSDADSVAVFLTAAELAFGD